MAQAVLRGAGGDGSGGACQAVLGARWSPVVSSVTAPVVQAVEAVGAPVLQAVAPVVSSVTAPVVQAVEAVAPVLQAVAPVVSSVTAPVVQAVEAVAPVLQAVAPVVSSVAPVVSAVTAPVTQAVAPVVSAVQAVAAPVQSTVGGVDPVETAKPRQSSDSPAPVSRTDEPGSPVTGPQDVLPSPSGVAVARVRVNGASAGPAAPASERNAAAAPAGMPRGLAPSVSTPPRSQPADCFAGRGVAGARRAQQAPTVSGAAPSSGGGAGAPGIPFAPPCNAGGTGAAASGGFGSGGWAAVPVRSLGCGPPKTLHPHRSPSALWRPSAFVSLQERPG